MHTGGPGVRHENVKSWKMRNTRVGPGIWQKMVYNEINEKKTHCSTWIMGRKLKNMEYETQTLYDLECAEKTE